MSICKWTPLPRAEQRAAETGADDCEAVVRQWLRPKATSLMFVIGNAEFANSEIRIGLSPTFRRSFALSRVYTFERTLRGCSPAQ